MPAILFPPFSGDCVAQGSFSLISVLRMRFLSGGNCLCAFSRNLCMRNEGRKSELRFIRPRHCSIHIALFLSPENVRFPYRSRSTDLSILLYPAVWKNKTNVNQQIHYSFGVPFTVVCNIVFSLAWFSRRAFPVFGGSDFPCSQSGL